MLTWQKYKEMETRKKILYVIILILILLILILGGYWVSSFLKKAQPQPLVNQVVNTPVVANNNQITNTIDVQSLQIQKDQQQQEKPMRLIAEPFVARFGSYNNQTEFTNFSDLDSYMTASLKTWVNQTYIAQLKKSMPLIDTYYAINTKVISTTVDSLDEATGKATLIINTQRQEVGAGNVQSKVYYQVAKVDMVKVGTEWKVDALFWQ